MTLSLDQQNRYRAAYRAQHSDWRPATEVYEAAIRGLLRPDMRVLDVGCGRGGVLEQLDEAVAFPFGVDPDWESLRTHRMPALPRAQAAAERLPFPAGCFDLILASWVFEHLDRPARTLAEMRRILAPGGRLVFMTPNATSLVAVLNRILRPLQSRLVPRLYGRAEVDTFPVQYRANTRRTLEYLATGGDFTLERLMFIADPTYLAFTPRLFRLSCWLARFTPPVHLVGILARTG